ncbi:DsbA family protein [bacterium]|nr:DsbA family protein [bacterium]
MRTRYFILTIVTLALVACTPHNTDLQAQLEAHPEILTNAIEKHPELIMDAIQKAARVAQEQSRKKQQADEEAETEKYFKNPLQADLETKRVSIGPLDAPITIIEYTDFQCPFCVKSYRTMNEVKTKYGDKVRIVIKNFPLPFHPMALPAALRFEALRQQDKEKARKFYHEIFSHAEELANQGEKFLDAQVKKTGADMNKMKIAISSPETKAAIEADTLEAQKFGFSGTPGFLVAGVPVKGAYPLETFQAIIDRKLATLDEAK